MATLSSADTNSKPYGFTSERRRCHLATLRSAALLLAAFCERQCFPDVVGTMGTTSHGGAPRRIRRPTERRSFSLASVMVQPNKDMAVRIIYNCYSSLCFSDEEQATTSRRTTIFVRETSYERVSMHFGLSISVSAYTHGDTVMTGRGRLLTSLPAQVWQPCERTNRCSSS